MIHHIIGIIGLCVVDKHGVIESAWYHAGSIGQQLNGSVLLQEQPHGPEEECALLPYVLTVSYADEVLRCSFPR